MSPLSLLRAALTVQVLLGLVRFVAPFTGVGIAQRIWVVHPVLGITIAVMGLGLAAVKVIDVAVEQQRTSQREPRRSRPQCLDPPRALRA